MSIRIIRSLNDLRPFGFDPLTGEACGIGYRLLVDLEYRAYCIYCECHGLKIDNIVNTDKQPDPPAGFEEAWNSKGCCSVMIAPDEWIQLGVFALLKNGYERVDIYEKWPSIPALQRQQQRQEYLGKQIKELGLKHGDYDKLPYEVIAASPASNHYTETFLMACMRNEYDTEEHRMCRIACDHVRAFVRGNINAPGNGFRNEHQMTGRVS